MHAVTFAAALALGLGASGATAQTLDTEENRTLYALGIILGNNLQQLSLTAPELTLVEAGLRDAVLGSEPRVDMAVYGAQIQTLSNAREAAAAAAEKAAALAFLDEMSQESGAERTASGLVYIAMTAGTGASPTATDTVNVHYHGTLRDGTVFDSSVDRGEPISFSLSGVIPCWTEGVQMMQVGAKSKLVCPSNTAYGDRGQGAIPGGAALVFEVELLAIE
ncbi:FKBP-type peptidyl-prolyl cis-trans isomerase [Candidatus Rariloculus sp.]|uniref:FKBP-type peptidyl-prolyl cis-trans isomerase n=1 Tax=Candidatus Rariloculus sp. TaxID=3101265 RepID=UPI003D0B2467